MSKRFIYQDQDRCIGCLACEIHCKTENDVPVGIRLSRIVPSGPTMIDDVPRMSFVFMGCFHCSEPLCVEACPTGAMIQRQADGIVYVDSDACVGCRECIEACPCSCPQYNEDTGKVTKCDYCKDRIDAGLKPACVTGCTTGALYWTE
ncbi:MAG: 4Fe-4S dicluster domain-containing protein [Nitrospirae bacterium]|nr:4Fe-4S dicluster domain-containing protein [Nitrospirota bacterium]MBF0593070.1 4Fe-4S dicluster domain-containing protein [Nitrospirota bacterium]